MKPIFKAVIAAALGAAALGAGAAMAKPAYCAHDHDHRAHAADYYDYYPADRYYRAGPYRDSGFSLSIRVGDGYDRYDRHDRYNRYNRYDRDRRYRGRRHGYRGDRGRVLNREIFHTRYRARIILTEEAYRTRRGPRLLCTVSARGPEARYVSKRRLHRIANRNCSRRARVRIIA